MLGAVLIAVGALLIVWSIVVWRYGDPITGIWYRIEQHRLEARYAQREERFTALAVPPATKTTRPQARPAPSISWPQLRVRLERAAHTYERSLKPGDPVGEIVVPRLSLNTMVVDGTGSSDLRRGPGLDSRSSLPGLDRLVYIAGHRTTFGAPFAEIDKLRVDDTIALELPYATFEYVVEGHRIVASDDVSVLRSRGREHLVLQACHPRFFASHRYLIDARLVSVALRIGGRTRTIAAKPGVS